MFRRSLDRRSILLVTLDSCRYDTMLNARAPNIKGVATLRKAMAPSYFTYGSHAAMFVGFTPGIAELAVPVLNPKFAKLFRLVGPGFAGNSGEGFVLEGRSIIDGFRRLGYRTIGTGAVDWFDTRTEPGRLLSADFERFLWAGDCYSLSKQLEWLGGEIDDARDQPVFAFLNVGETHIPYWHEGAPWDRGDNPCVPFQTADRREDCRVRQAACLEFVDKALGPLLDRFRAATNVVCADHGDCWGEDGLWAHGMSHPMTLTVPLLVRLRGTPL